MTETTSHEEHRMSIYFVQGQEIYPVGTAGAVVIAWDTEEALNLAKTLLNPQPPIFIGTAAKHFTKSKVVMLNSTDY